MSKTLFIAFLATAALQGQNVDSSVLAPVELTYGQTLRISVSASPGGTCLAQLGFLDAVGKNVGPSSSVSLKAGESAYLDLPAASPRAQIRPRITPGPDTVPSDCTTSLSVRNTADAGGPHEGIQVHGHWSIDIRDPDGKLAQHHEFENSIDPYGQNYLIDLLKGYGVPSDYGIWLQGTGVCTSVNQGCVIVRSITVSPGSELCAYFFCATSLTDTYSYAYPLANVNAAMVLAGSITAQQAGTINRVTTMAHTCYSGTTVATTSPAACVADSGATAGGYYNPFTATSINPISIAAGQLIQVTVTISFS